MGRHGDGEIHAFGIEKSGLEIRDWRFEGAGHGWRRCVGVAGHGRVVWFWHNGGGDKGKERKMRIGLWVVVAVAGGLWIGAARAEWPGEVRTEAPAGAVRLQADNGTAAPVLVVTTPRAMQTDVDPALERIEVTFDRLMRDKSWSWTGGGDTYPQTTGKPFYDEKRMTCTMPVKLEPGKVYWVGVNSPSYRNFVSEEGVASPWYILLFSTRSADGKPTPLPADRVREAKKISGAYEKAVGSVPKGKGKASTREGR